MNSINWEKMITCAIRNEPCDEISRELQNLENDKWEYLISNSLYYGISALLYEYIKNHVEHSSIPKEPLNHLKRSRMNIAIRRAEIEKQITTVAMSLSSMGIPMMLLKGAYFTFSVYERKFIRDMSDIDIMVPKNALLEVYDILRQLGYSPECTDSVDHFVMHCQHMPGFLKEKSFKIEPHWTIARPTYPFDVDTANIWKRARKIPNFGVDIMVPSYEDAIMHTCINTIIECNLLSNGRRGSVITDLLDIHEILVASEYSIEWEMMLHEAKRWNIDKYVYLMLRLQKDIIGNKIPSRVYDELKPQSLDDTIYNSAKIITIYPREYHPVDLSVAWIKSTRFSKIKERLIHLHRCINGIAYKAKSESYLFAVTTYPIRYLIGVANLICYVFYGRNRNLLERSLFRFLEWRFGEWHISFSPNSSKDHLFYEYKRDHSKE